MVRPHTPALHDISWPAGNAIAESKQDLLSKVMTLLCSCASAVEQTPDQYHNSRVSRHLPQKTQDSLLRKCNSVGIMFVGDCSSRMVKRPSSNRRVSGPIPCLSSLHIEISRGKILIPNLLMVALPSVCQCVWMAIAPDDMAALLPSAYQYVYGWMNPDLCVKKTLNGRLDKEKHFVTSLKIGKYNLKNVGTTLYQLYFDWSDSM